MSCVGPTFLNLPRSCLIDVLLPWIQEGIYLFQSPTALLLSSSCKLGYTTSGKHSTATGLPEQGPRKPEGTVVVEQTSSRGGYQSCNQRQSAQFQTNQQQTPQKQPRNPHSNYQPMTQAELFRHFSNFMASSQSNQQAQQPAPQACQPRNGGNMAASPKPPVHDTSTAAAVHDTRTTAAVHDTSTTAVRQQRAIEPAALMRKEQL